MKDFLIGSLIFISCLSFVIWLAIKSVDRDEIIECRKWQEYSAQYSGFYLVKWQADQCAAHNIIINSPVK